MIWKGFQRGYGKYYPLSAKIFLKKRGLDILPVTRLNLPALDTQDYRKLEAMMATVKGQAEKLGISIIDF